MATRWNMMSVPDWYCITYHLLAIGCIVMRLPGRSKMCSGTYCLFVIWWNCLAEVTGYTGSLTLCWSWMRFGKSIWEKWKQDVLCHYSQSNNVMSLPAERNVQHDSQSICHRMTQCHESPWQIEWDALSLTSDCWSQNEVHWAYGWHKICAVALTVCCHVMKLR